MITAAALGGYILEEVLAELLAHNGYRLLAAHDDQDVLVDKGHGLVIHGRGADHQADALGELQLPIPFALPVRLFLEAKNRSSKVDLTDVRNAHGLLADVNQHYGADAAYRKPLARYEYRYAIFSAAGFTEDAQKFALAHQLSLIDLSGPGFRVLTQAVDAATGRLHARAEQLGLETFPIGRMRRALREAWGAEESVDATSANSAYVEGRETGTISDVELLDWAAQLKAALYVDEAQQGLLLGFPPAAFVLALKPDSMQDFEDHLEQTTSPSIPVVISFSGISGQPGDWAIRPTTGPHFVLRFGLPGALENWLLRQKVEHSGASELALEHLSHISIFVEDRLVTLRYTPAEALAPEEPLPTSASDTSELRRSYHAVEDEPAGRMPDADVPRTVGPDWSLVSVNKLLSQLDSQAPRQAKLIRAAAAAGGRLSRDEVVRVADFDRARTLRGLTRPTNRITAELIRKGDLGSHVEYPFYAVYEYGVKATHFEVPSEVVELVQQSS